MTKTAKVKKATAASAPTADGPQVVVSGGDPSRLRSIVQSLKGVHTTLVTVPWEDYPENLDSGWAAMVIAEPLPASIGAAVDAVRGQPAGRLLPIYALVDEDASSRKARAAYRAVKGVRDLDWEVTLAGRKVAVGRSHRQPLAQSAPDTLSEREDRARPAGGSGRSLRASSLAGQEARR